MKKSCLLLVAVILIAGCTQSGLTPVVKSLPEVKEFLNQYPEATITASAYSPTAVKFVVENFREHCPNLGEEGKSYQKVAVIDGKTKQTLIVWVEAKNNEFVCAIRTSLSGEVATTTSSTTTTIPPTTTTTLPPTTTTVAATTTSQATTTSTTLPPTTITVNATNISTTTSTSGTTTSSSTTTISQLAELSGSVSVFKYTGSDVNKAIRINVAVSNTGNANATRVPVAVYLINSANSIVYTLSSDFYNISAGGSAIYTFTPNYKTAGSNYKVNASIDYSNLIQESNELNNNVTSSPFTIPFP